jgi:hypothetical protein
VNRPENVEPPLRRLTPAKSRRYIVIALLLAACRTTRVAEGPPLAPLTSTTEREAARQLAARRAQFGGERCLIRLHFPNGRSARAQLQVDAALRMLLTVYTPIGTTAARFFAAGGDVVFVNDYERTAWSGRATDLTGALDTFTSQAGILLAIGLPPSAGVSLDYSPSGLARATLADIVVTYDPPSYPPQHVTITRGDQRIEIEHLESVAGTDVLRAPEIPRDYRCCVAPQL